MNQNNRIIPNFIKFWLPVLIWAVVIFSFSAKPASPTSQIHWQDFIIKKTAHIVFFGILALFLFRAIKSSGLPKFRASYLSILFSTLYGLTDEFHQSFTPGREPRLRDVLFDTLGAALFIFLVYKKRRYFPKIINRLFEKLDLTR